MQRGVAAGVDGMLLEEQARILEMIVRDKPLEEVLAALCRIVERCSERPVRAAILLVDASGAHLRTGAAPSLPEAYNRAVDGVPIARDLGTCAAAAARREVVVTPDIANDPGWVTLKHLPLGLGLYAAWSMPIVSSTDTVLGTFGTYFTEPREPVAEERRLVEVVARTAALAIERARDLAARVAADRALAESRARLDYTVRLSGVGFWYCDLPFSELLWDAQVKRHFFLPPDAPVTIDTFFERIHPDDRESTRRAIDASIADHAAYDVTYRTVHPRTGEIQWIRALGGATYDADGRATHFDGVTVDITTHKRDEERLRQQDRRKDEFLATLAHELRNPLAPIRTGLHLLGLDISSDVAAATRAKMERQLGHLVHMIDDLLDISRVTLGKITLKKQRTDLRTVLDSALETTRAIVEAGNHQLAVRLPSEALPLEVDATRIAQVLANLINNAAKYTANGGRIEIAVEREGAFVTVRVTDNGVGIAPELLPDVFEMFMQIGQSIERSQGGLGIGLTLARRLVEMHGGTVTAESRGAGQGSSFLVKLPLASVDEPDAGAKVRSSTPKPPAGGLRILVVDDNVDGAEMLAMLLEQSGNRTRLAHTGPDALDAAADFRPQAIFLDIGLPGLDGYEVAKRLRASDASPQPLLIALTGWGAAEDRRQARSAGFDHHLVKPIEASQVDVVLADAPRDLR